MSVLVELNIEYNRNFSKGVIALARENYVLARSYLERAAKALNEIAVRRTGENKDYTQDWLFDIVKEIGDLDRKINNDRSKEKLTNLQWQQAQLRVVPALAWLIHLITVLITRHTRRMHLHAKRMDTHITSVMYVPYTLQIVG